MAAVLKPHASVKHPLWRVSGEVQRLGRELVWRMQVEGPGPHTHEKFGDDPRKNWQLWEWDVVEAFFQLRRHPDDFLAPYLEVQLSPRGKGLVLVILEPRKRFYTPLVIDFRPQVQNHTGGWSMEVKLTLPAEFSEGELWGGLFACLGVGERGFYSLQPNPEERPDFHRPELFVAL